MRMASQVVLTKHGKPPLVRWNHTQPVFPGREKLVFFSFAQGIQKEISFTILTKISPCLNVSIDSRLACPSEHLEPSGSCNVMGQNRSLA